VTVVEAPNGHGLLLMSPCASVVVEKASKKPKKEVV